MNVADFQGLSKTEAIADAIARGSLRDYFDICVIDCLPDPKPFGEVAEPWQYAEVLDPIIPAIENLVLSREERAARPAYSGPSGYLNTYPRGHNKSSFIATACNYCLRYGRRELPILISVAAADQGQAAKIRDCMQRQAQLNPWIGKHIAFNKWEVVGPGGRLTILSSDAGSAYGGSSDFIICDEITHWKSERLWTAMESESMKREHCVFFVITNAGYHGTWQHEALLKCKADPKWYVNDKPGFRAGWMNPEKVRSVREGIVATTGSPAEAMRLIDNIWIASRRFSVFSPADVERIFSPHANPWVCIN